MIRIEADTAEQFGTPLNSGSNGIGSLILTANAQLAAVDPDSAQSLDLQIHLIAADFVFNSSSSVELGYGAWLVQVTQPTPTATNSNSNSNSSSTYESTLSLTGLQSPLPAKSLLNRHRIANLDESELSLIHSPAIASVLGAGPTLQFGGSTTSRIWLDSIDFDCVTCRALVFECSGSASECEIIAPALDDEFEGGGGAGRLAV